MRRGLDVLIQKYFGIITDSLKNENKIIKKAFSRFKYDPSDYTGKGISDLYEHHIQYILFKNFLKKGPFFVYMEDRYGRGKGHCDLTLYGRNWERSIWIEIKVTGWCEDFRYRMWVKSDAQKLRKFHKKGAHKYLFVSSVEDERPNKAEWEKWFKKYLKEVKFNPNLFGYFITQFSDGKEFKKGYYAVCLLEVQ